MDWNAVSAIANVFAAIAAILSVIYLGIQIRKNTDATHSQTYQLATSALAEMAGIIGSDKELARIFRIGMVDPAKLDEDESAHRPGMQAWWKDRKFAFSKSFREFLDSSRSDEITSPESRRL